MHKLSESQLQILDERWNGLVFDEHDLRKGFLQAFSELGAEGLSLHLALNSRGIPNNEQVADLAAMLSLDVGITRRGELKAKLGSDGERIVETLRADDRFAVSLVLITLLLKSLKRLLFQQDAEAAASMIYIPT